MNKSIGEYWDSRLTASERDPYPLAPGDLVMRGLVNKENYRNANWRLGKFCCGKMEPELRKLPLGEIHILGSGLGRDLSWIKDALYFGFKVNIFDASAVACKIANDLIAWQSKPRGQQILFQKITVKQTEILAGWSSGEIDETPAKAIFASQFLEHQKENTGKFLEHFAEFLRKDPSRKIYLNLPRLEDNPPDRVLWNSAVPPKDHQWQKPLRTAFGSELNIDALGTHLYFHRKYTFFRIGVK